MNKVTLMTSPSTSWSCGCKSIISLLCTSPWRM
ncbi:hypothetical protein LINPERPRIM_LOCUS40350 [Linum perenne]